MQLAFSLSLKDENASARVQAIAAAGFDGIEPTLGAERTIPVVGNVRASAEKLKAIADRANLKIPSMRGGPGFWGTFASSNSSKRTAAVDLAKQGFEALKIMGGDVLLIVPGQWEAEQSYREVWNNALDTAKRIADEAERMGIDVALENVQNRFLFSPLEWMNFLDSVGSTRVRMYFDAGNVVYLGTGWPDRWMRELGTKYIRRIHIKDAVARQVLNLGEGEVDWRSVKDARHAIGYEDWVGVELDVPETGPEQFFAETCRKARELLA